MKTWEIPVTWEMCGNVVVDAHHSKGACLLFFENLKIRCLH